MEEHQQDRAPADSTGAPRPASFPGTAPDLVQRLSASRGFGDLIDTRHEISRKGALFRGCVLIVGSSGLLAVLFGVVGAPDLITSSTAFYFIFNFIRLFLLCSWVAGVGFVLRGIFVGSRSHYLYAGGLVHNRRGGPFAVAWPELAAFKSFYNRRGTSQAGRILGYRVTTRDGRSFTIPLVLVNGRDRFIDVIIGNLRAYGRPIEQRDVPMSENEMPDPPPGQMPAHAPPPPHVAPCPPPMTDEPSPYAASAPVAPYQMVISEQRQIWVTKGSRSIGFGAMWVLVGLLITAISYRAAIDHGGGAYLVAWAPILYGVYRIFSGFRLLRKSKSDRQ